MLEFNFFGHGHTVLGHGGSAEFFVDDNVPAFGAEGHLHCICKCVHTSLQIGPCFAVKLDVFCHG